MNKYWETAPDKEIDTGKNILKYWKTAEKLQISAPTWTDKDGNEKRGRTVALNLSALRETPGAIDLLKQII